MKTIICTLLAACAVLAMANSAHAFYDAVLGRFATRDPIEEKGGINLYRYVGNNPINKVDPLGLEPGHPYGTEDVAGYNAVKDAIPKSMSEVREYAGAVYRNPDGSYSYTAPNPGTVDSSTPLLPGQTLPDGAKLVGDYHTHSNYSNQAGTIVTDKAGAFYDSDNFSTADKRSYDNQYNISINYNDVDPFYGYLGTPSGSFQRYAPNGVPLGGDTKTFPVNLLKKNVCP